MLHSENVDENFFKAFHYLEVLRNLYNELEKGKQKKKKKFNLNIFFRKKKKIYILFIKNKKKN